MSIKPFAEDRMKLLSLMHVRAAYPPVAWALLDTRESFITCISDHQDELYFNEKCVKMYGDEYGTMTE